MKIFKSLVFIVFLLLFSIGSANAIDLRTFQASTTDVTINSTSMSISAFSARNKTVLTQKDYTGTEIDHDFNFSIDGASGTQGACGLLSFASIGGDLYSKQLDGTLLAVNYFDAGANKQIYLLAVSNGTLQQPLVTNISLSTTYWGTLTKIGTSATLTIYSDSGRTTPIGTQNITLDLNDSYTNTSGITSYNTQIGLASTVSATVSNIVDNLDTFSIATPAQRTNESTITLTGKSPNSATVAWTGTNGAVSGNTTADGSGNWSATVTLGASAENVLTFTTSGETNQVISITQGGVDFVIDSAIIDTSVVPESTWGPCKNDVNYDGLFVIPSWIQGGNTKVKPGSDVGSGLEFRTLTSAAVGYGTPETLSSFNDVYAAFKTNQIQSGKWINNKVIADDYSTNFNYVPIVGLALGFGEIAIADDVLSACVDNLNWTYALTSTGSVLNVRTSLGPLQNTTNAYVTPILSISIGLNDATGQILCGVDNTKLLLVSNLTTVGTTSLDLYTYDNTTWSSAIPVTSDMIDYKFFQAVMTSDGQLRIFYTTSEGLKCKTLSTSLVLGSEISVLDNVTAFTATGVNSSDDRVSLGITKSPYLMNYIYEDGVLDTIPVELYSDVQAGSTFCTSPTIEPVKVPFMFQNMAGYMSCATTEYTVAQRSGTGMMVGVGRKELSQPILITHSESGFDKSVIVYSDQGDWSQLRSYDWLASEFEGPIVEGTTQKYSDQHNRTIATLAPSLKYWLVESGVFVAPLVRETDDIITANTDINLTDITATTSQPTITDAQFKDILVDSLGRAFLVHKDGEDLNIAVFDTGVWTDYSISTSSIRQYWQGSRIDTNGDIHLGITATDIFNIPYSANGSTNAVRLDYFKLTYTGSGFTCKAADGTPITIPSSLPFADNVLTCPDAIAYYSSLGGGNSNLTTDKMLYIGYFDKRSLELDSLNNPVFAGLQVNVINFEDAFGIYVYRYTGATWEIITVSEDVNLDALPPIITKSLDGDSLIILYAVDSATKYKVSSDDGATWGAEKTLFNTSYSITNIWPVASTRGLDIVSEKKIDRSYTEIVIESVGFAFGSIQITIEDDSGDPVVGATWAIDGEGSYISGQIVTDVLIGDRSISCSVVAGYTKPANFDVTVTDGVTAIDTAVYIKYVPPSEGVTGSWGSSPFGSTPHGGNKWVN